MSCTLGTGKQCVKLTERQNTMDFSPPLQDAAESEAAQQNSGKRVTFQLAPQAERCALGAGVDCAGPDTGSAEHAMALGVDSLPVKATPPRPDVVLRETEVEGDPPTRKYTFIDQHDTLRCILEAQIEQAVHHVDFYGVMAKRKPTGMDVVVLLRLKRGTVRDTDMYLKERLRIATKEFQHVVHKLRECER